MNRHALAAAVMVLCVLALGGPAQAICTPPAARGMAAEAVALDEAAASRRQYEKYLMAIQGSFPSPTENFVLDEETFGKVQKVFDKYARSRVARVGLRRFDETDVVVAGSMWSLDQSLTYLLQHGTALGRKMAAMGKGISEEDDAKMMRMYKEDDFRLAESFWALTGQQMVDHARSYYNVSVGQLSSALVSTPYGTFRGQYYNPNFLSLKPFLDQALSNYQICAGKFMD